VTITCGVFASFANSRKKRHLVMRLHQCFQGFRCGLRIAARQHAASNNWVRNKLHPQGELYDHRRDHAKQAIHDKLESQIKTAEAKLETLKAKAETAKANVEIRAIAELLTRKQTIRHKLQELKKSDGGRWEQAKADLEARIAEFEKSVKGIESKAI
jgi:hypothetical protein